MSALYCIHADNFSANVLPVFRFLCLFVLRIMNIEKHDRK